MSILTNEQIIPSVAELIAARPELQSNSLEEFFSKIKLPKVATRDLLEINVGGRSLKFQQFGPNAHLIVRHPFAYFNDVNGKPVILSGLYDDGAWVIHTISADTNICYVSGIIAQMNKYEYAPEFIDFVNFAAFEINNSDFRSEATAERENAQEFFIHASHNTIRFHGEVIEKTAALDTYSIFIGSATAKIKHDKLGNKYSLVLPHEEVA